MHLILTGATGLVGSAVLDAMIKMKEVTKISIISRRPVKMAEDAKDPRINVIIHKDFTKYDSELLDKLRGATGCVWALGISQTAVDKDEYIKITKDYALAAAEAFRTLTISQSSQSSSESPTVTATTRPFNFIYVSGVGATFTPHFYSPLYGIIKGQTELSLASLRRSNPLFRASTVRPVAIDPSRHPAILPYIPSTSPAMSSTWGRLATGFAERYWTGMHSPTEPLGRVLVDMAMGRFEGKGPLEGAGVEVLDGGFTVLENNALRRLSGLE